VRAATDALEVGNIRDIAFMHETRKVNTLITLGNRLLPSKGA
jgi:hypothetical protein